jgi:hypothetical protein
VEGAVGAESDNKDYVVLETGKKKDRKECSFKPSPPLSSPVSTNHLLPFLFGPFPTALLSSVPTFSFLDSLMRKNVNLYFLSSVFIPFRYTVTLPIYLFN